MVYASAPGKVILSGEHSVVYGYPAIAAAIDIRCKVSITDGESGLFIRSKELGQQVRYSLDQLLLVGKQAVFPKFDNIALCVKNTFYEHEISLEVDVTSDIPIGAGLGSSAAVSVATVAACNSFLKQPIDLKKISKVAFEAEKITHGRPSGIDNSIATFGGYIRFENGFIEQKQMTSNLPILIVDTKIPRNTKKLVEGVAKLKDLYPEIINPILSTMGNVADLIHQNLEIFDLSTLGDLFKINQGLLDAIGVGHPKLSNLMNIATEFGAVGTKLTGAGGGGCFLVLGKDQIQINEIASELKNFNVDVFVTKISSRGVIIE